MVIFLAGMKMNKFLERKLKSARTEPQVLNTRYGGKATEEEQLNRQRAHEHTKIFGGNAARLDLSCLEHCTNYM